MSSSLSFSERLEQNQLLVFDGGLGTMLYNKGVFINTSFDLVNLNNPEWVQEIHEEYLKAGADVIESNTFGANYYKLKAHGIEDKLYDINLQGVKIARQAAGPNHFVAGSIGPLGIKIEPLGPTSFEEAQDAFEMQVLPMLEGGVDLFVVETFTSLKELEQAVIAIRRHSNLPIVASITVGDDGSTLYGTTPENYAPFLDDLDVQAIGLNCSVGPKTMLDTIQVIEKYTSKPLMAQPNAGHPRVFQDRTIYMCSPEYMASYARKLIKSGVQLIGGCCGTTPEHIREIARSVKALQPMRVHHHYAKKRVIKKPHVKPIPVEQKSRLAGAIARKQFVISVELTPPKGCDPSVILRKAKTLHTRGIDAINLPDGPRASSRMSNQILSMLIRQQVGIEPIPHYCCRDRNLLGMQSDLLGLYAGGIQNVLLVTGDPPKLGDYPDATAVFDVDAIGLTNMVHGLNHGLDLGQNPIKKPTGFFIGVGVNPYAVDLEREIKRFFYKVEAGAEYAITQPVFDVDALLSFFEKIESHRIPIIAGIWPLASYRNAEFMRNEVPGVVIPDHIMERMQDAEEAGRAKEEGIAIAQEMVLRLKDAIQGVQVSAPFGKIQSALDVVSVIGR